MTSLSSRPSTARPDGASRAATALREETAATLDGLGSIRLLDFVLFVLLVTGIGVNIGTYSTHLVTAVILVVALTRRPTVQNDRLPLVVAGFAVMLTYIGIVSLFSEPGPFAADWETRLLRMAAICMLALVIASGRIHLRSAVYGYCAALMVNVPLFYLGLVPAPYGRFLTGFVGDKNVSGLAYCVFGLLAVAVARRLSHRLALLAVFGTCVWLTGSRTSIAAYLAACAWLLLAPRLPMLGRWILAALTAYFIRLTAEDFSQVGVFSDREGSDLLRARIDEAALDKVHSSGFFGHGLGEAYVVLDEDRWFFHNSYWTALVEGGWPWTIAVVGLTVLLMMRPFRSALSTQEIYAQALGLAVLVCATRLGEVFLTVYWAVPLGVALQASGRNDTPTATPGQIPAVRMGSAEQMTSHERRMP